MPSVAYIGGLFHREHSRFLERCNSMMTNVNELEPLDEVVKLDREDRFSSKVIQEISRTRRHGGKLSIILLKVEHLEELAELYGEKIKNLVLERVAYALKGSKRREDSIGYISEGEFAFLLPATDKDGVEIVRKRIKQNLSYVDFVDAEKGFKRIKIHKKIGVATYPDDGEDYATLIWKARKEYEYDIK